MEELPNKNVVLEMATPADVEAYIAIDKKLQGLKTYSTITKEDEVLDEMRKGPVYILKKDGTPVGFVSYEVKEDGGVYISGLAVDPAHQGGGIGRKAMEQLLTLEQVTRAPYVYLVTHPENDRAVKLYESLGFVIGEQTENYFGDGEPRIKMIKSHQKQN